LKNKFGSCDNSFAMNTGIIYRHSISKLRCISILIVEIKSAHHILFPFPIFCQYGGT